jgi:hypothetical protein
MTKPKSALDPFLLALGNAPRERLLPRQQAAAFLGIGLTTLDEWRSRSLPPPWTDLRGMVRYQVGDLSDFVKSLPRGSATAVAGTDLAPLPAGELQRMGLYSPIMRGGRRKKQITSFASWLTDGDPAGPPWRFAMIDDLGSQYLRRPVDLIATLELELTDDDPCVELTMLEYAQAMAEYAQAATTLAEKERLDRELPRSQGSTPARDPHL